MMTETVIGKIRFRRAGNEDRQAITSLLAANPMKAWIRLAVISLDSEQLNDYVLAEDLSNQCCPIGLYHVSAQKLYLNGESTEAIYIGKLRVDPHYRNKIRILVSGFQSIPQLFPEADGKLWFTSIAAENSQARRILESGTRGLPAYHRQGNLLTVAISTASGKNRGLTRPAESRDIERLAAFLNGQLSHYQFAPAITPDWFQSLPAGLVMEDFRILECDQNIKGCAAIWDQRRYTDIVVEGYASPLNWLRGLYNLGTRLTGMPHLPAVGQSLNQIMLSFLAFQQDDGHLFCCFVQEMLYLARQKNAELVLTGLHESNSRLTDLTRQFKLRIYQSVIDTVVPVGQSPIALTGLPVQPEIGFL